MRRTRLLALAASIVISSCSGSRTGLNNWTKSILAGAGRVEVYRIDGGGPDHVEVHPKPGEPSIGGFRVTAQGKDQGPEFATRLADVLLDPANHTIPIVKCYWPGVVFRIYKGQECVDVMICFHCHNYYLGPPSTARVLETDGFEGTPAGPKLVRLAKEAFPNDKQIQALKED